MSLDSWTDFFFERYCQPSTWPLAARRAYVLTMPVSLLAWVIVGFTLWLGTVIGLAIGAAVGSLIDLWRR